MQYIFPKKFQPHLDRLRKYFNTNLIKNVLLFTGGIMVFIGGVVLYGIIINLRDVPLREEMRNKGFTKLEDPYLIIERRRYALELYQDSVLIKTYRANFGRNIKVPKSMLNDNATPVGEYKVCKIDTVHKYYKFLRLNYPNLNDAAEALRKGFISQKVYDNLRFEFYYAECPGAETQLGGNIGIHGLGEYNNIFKNLPFVYNWTDGSVAISNEDIEELYSVVKEGTKVVIK